MAVPDMHDAPLPTDVDFRAASSASFQLLIVYRALLGGPDRGACRGTFVEVNQNTKYKFDRKIEDRTRLSHKISM
jgi:hypothetical protein